MLGNERTGGVDRRAGLMIGALVAVNVVLWIAAWTVSKTFLFLLGPAWLAYGFGLRHAVDADHISAIDNVTRKLMQEGKRPLGVGFYFSLGHSTIVVLLCSALIVATERVQKYLPVWQHTGAEAGTLISGGFLYLIGFLNIVVLWDVVRKARMLRAGQAVDTDAPAMTGLLGRILRPVLAMVSQSRHMYLVGFLFGLGFDTATEVGVLALAVRTGQAHVPLLAAMLLPALFTAGMCLVDTVDGILMLRAYGWAQVKPERRITYNVTITAVSVLVAFVVGTHEMLSLLNVHDLPTGRIWSFVTDNLGFFVVGLFLLIWALAATASRARNLETA